ncbi:MAG TPA: hypothetical protein VKG44_02270 [Candidatus Baltobacteraceae bacterium]|nr:hypothetical protein [Candidatus Baltobacteraceae bacterium]
MGITDIPDQIAKALKYSLRSRGSFIVSLVTAIVVLAVAYDLIYSFVFVRANDVKDVHYGPAYWLGLAALALLLPALAGAVAYARARALLQPFPRGKVGIAIAPFEVFSVAPETLGTANALQALDIVATQFFRLVQNTLSEYPWADGFEFRFLPPYVRVTTRDEAVKRRAELGATLLVWGVITQRSRQPLEIKLALQAIVRNYDFSHLSIEEFPMQPLQFFTILEAATYLASCGEKAHALEMLKAVLPLAAQIDEHAPGGNCVADVNAEIARLASSEPAGAARAAVPEPT